MKAGLFFIFLFFVSLAYASDLGVYPDELNFNIDVGEKVCNRAIVFSSDNISIEVNDYWAENENIGRDIEKYYLKSEIKGIEMSYPSEFIFKGKKEIKVCVKGNIRGKFHGLLMVRGENVGIGTWLNVNVKGSIFSITGKTIYDIEKGNLMGMMLFFTFILLLVLLYLIWKGNKISRISREN